MNAVLTHPAGETALVLTSTELKYELRYPLPKPVLERCKALLLIGITQATFKLDGVKYLLSVKEPKQKKDSRTGQPLWTALLDTGKSVELAATTAEDVIKGIKLLKMKLISLSPIMV